ncbi:MAG TPA: replication-relaxation family protein [Candidatus Angelobacter sp.]|nr:replication-relaxation family protein [Candidatus Angelobacter sp.]
MKELATAKVIDREQAKKIAGFKSTTRANDRLLKLTRASLLRRFFLGTRAGGTKAIYSLSTKGAQIAEVDGRLIQRKSNSLLIGDLFVEHQLAVNSVWIQAKFTPVPVADVQFSRWLIFPSALSKSTPLMPDGYFELKSTSGMYCLFCEVDRGTESLKVWSRKISLYLQLAANGEFQTLFKQSRFRVLVAVLSERRLNILRRTTALHTEKVFWFATLEEINNKGLFAPIWKRPVGEQKVPLL